MSRANFIRIGLLAAFGAALIAPAPVALAQGTSQLAPLPPARPAGLGGARTASATTPAPMTIQPGAPATQPASAPADRPAINERNAVERLNAYFNSFTTLQANFIQFAADGRRFEGRLSIARPGKMRFEYKAPATIEVIADGTSVAIRDRKLATQDLYSIGQTPLKFLLRERIDLAKDTTVKGVSVAPNLVKVSLEDKSTLGGTSKITLSYDPVANELRQWVVIDPQGYETSVSIYGLDTQRRPDPKLFAINYERVLEDKK
ncbi:MAG: outer-membrane lipoprotein carrier protein LolA [Bosea sp. (in: a-proteobacteria)]